jgi:hypothetical protein
MGAYGGMGKARATTWKWGESRIRCESDCCSSDRASNDAVFIIKRPSWQVNKNNQHPLVLCVYEIQKKKDHVIAVKISRNVLPTASPHSPKDC